MDRRGRCVRVGRVCVANARVGAYHHIRGGRQHRTGTEPGPAPGRQRARARRRLGVRRAVALLPRPAPRRFGKPVVRQGSDGRGRLDMGKRALRQRQPLVRCHALRRFRQHLKPAGGAVRPGGGESGLRTGAPDGRVSGDHRLSRPHRGDGAGTGSSPPRRIR